MGSNPHVQYDAYMIQSKINDGAFLGCVEGPVAGIRDHKTRQVACQREKGSTVHICILGR